jgi:hypothetical protein
MAASGAHGAADDCNAAGPLGDRIKATTTAFCSGPDICDSFCALEIQACGTSVAPLPGDPKDASNNSIYQYQNLFDCTDSCSRFFNKANEYALSSVGNSMACRLVQAVNAALVVDPNALMDCGDTGLAAAGICTGGASP